MTDKNDAIIVNGNGKSVVLISLDEFNAMDETQYLLSSKANKKQLDSAINSFNNDKGIERKLMEL